MRGTKYLGKKRETNAAIWEGKYSVNVNAFRLTIGTTTSYENKTKKHNRTRRIEYSSLTYVCHLIPLSITTYSSQLQWYHVLAWLQHQGYVEGTDGWMNGCDIHHQPTHYM